MLSGAVFAKPFYELAPKEIDKVLSDVRLKYQTFEDRALAVACLRLETPYFIVPSEKLRPPLFQTNTADDTFVLATLTLAEATFYSKQAFYNEAKIKYYKIPLKRPPLCYFENVTQFTYYRLHSINESYLCKDITANLLAPEQLKDAKIHGQFREKSFYIPCNKVNAGLLKKLSKKIYGVWFVREKAVSSEIVISHEGFIAEGKYLIHASSIEKKVVKADFLKYIEDNSDYFDGIIVSELHCKN